jgi:hypothetical protein
MAKKTSKVGKRKLATKTKASKKKPTPKKKAAKKKATTPKKRPTTKALSVGELGTRAELVQPPNLVEEIEEVGCCVITYFETTFYEQTTRRECELKPENYPGSTVVFQPNQPCPANARPAAEMDDIDNFD